MPASAAPDPVTIDEALRHGQDDLMNALRESQMTTQEQIDLARLHLSESRETLARIAVMIASGLR